MMVRVIGAAEPTATKRNWGRYVLVASLALNMLLIGAAGAAIFRFRMAPPVASRISTNLIEYLATLPPDRRRDIWSATREERRKLRPARAEVRQAREAWRASLSSEPFDRERFVAAQTRVLEAEVKARMETKRLFVDIVTHMTPQERAAFAAWRPSAGSAEHKRRWWRERLGELDEEAKDPPDPQRRIQP